MSRLDDELDRGEAHEAKRVVKTLRGDSTSFYVECWCGEHLPDRNSQAKAMQVHRTHQEEAR